MTDSVSLKAPITEVKFTDSDGDVIILKLNSETGKVQEFVNDKLDNKDVKKFVITNEEKYKDETGTGTLPDGELKRKEIIENLVYLFSASTAMFQRVTKIEVPTTKEEWRSIFKELGQKQNKNINACSTLLKKEKLQLIYRTWSDIGRSFGSCGGSNITDMQFFSVLPSVWRPTDVKQMTNKDYVTFPALRPPNYSDEIDIQKSSDINLKVKNRWGQVVELTLRDFMANIGHFITDLPEEADWSDSADKKDMQVSSQFSILPAPTGQADIGIAAFGYQQKNLHIIIGPSGDIGWGPEQQGDTKMYFRDGEELKTITLKPEDRKEVSKAFFKKPEKNESVEVEAQRYKAVENFVYHIQVQMDIPSGYVAERGSDVGMDRGAVMCNNYIKYSKSKSMGVSSMLFGGYRSSKKKSKCSSRSRSRMESDRKKMDSGLNLARVVAGDSIGKVQKRNKVPQNSSGKLATRTKGVGMRLTKMYYAVAKDGIVNEDRITRFCKQMSFERRSKGLQHGSLVTGIGSWGGPNMAPIKLSKYTSDIWNTFVQYPNVNIIQFYGAHTNIPTQYTSLQPGAAPTVSSNKKYELCKAKSGTVYAHRL